MNIFKTAIVMSDRPPVGSERDLRSKHRRGALAALNPLTLPARAWRRFLHRHYRPRFCRQNYIFRHEGPFPPEKRIDCTFEHYQSFEELPEHVIEDMKISGLGTRFDMDRRELEEHATLWIAFVDNHFASRMFTRKGQYIGRWFLDLRPEDIVFFRGLTHPDYRGRGLLPSLIRHAAHEALGHLDYAYTDCRTYNKAAVRCIEKIGFSRVAVMKAITREWALCG